MKKLPEVQDTSNVFTFAQLKPFDITEEYEQEIKPTLDKVHNALDDAHVPHVMSVVTAVERLGMSRFAGTHQFMTGHVHPLRDAPLTLAQLCVTCATQEELAMRVTEQLLSNPDMLYATLLMLNKHGISVDFPAKAPAPH